MTTAAKALRLFSASGYLITAGTIIAAYADATPLNLLTVACAVGACIVTAVWVWTP